MDRTEQLLRAEFGRDDAVLHLESGPLLARVIRIRRRRTITTASVAALTLVVAGAVTTVVRTGASDDGRLVAVDPTGPGPGRLNGNQVRFADSSHGYALRTECGPPQPSPSGTGPRPTTTSGDLACSSVFSATSDAGVTWVVRTAPAGVATSRASRQLWVFDRQTVMVGNVTDGSERWLSADGGRTWAKPEQSAPTPVASVPQAAVLVPGPKSTPAPITSAPSTPPSSAPAEVSTGPTDFTVIVPDGTTGRLPGPPGVELTSNVVAASDGSSWAGCLRLPTHEPCVAVTTDSGKSWRTSQLPALPASSGDTPPRPDQVSTVDGRTVYLSVRYESAGATDGRRPDRLLALLRSTDGGESWTALRLPEDSYDSGEAVATGALIGIVDQRIARLPANGTTFRTDAAGPHPVTNLRRSGSYLLADPADPAGEQTVYLSKDGLTWSQITPP